MEIVTEKTTNNEVKPKKKLSKILIVRLIMAGFAVICLALAIVFTCIKTPIDGSIYCINTSLEERQAVWEKKQEELFDYYDQRYPASYYEDNMETSRFLKMLYKTSVSQENEDTKQLNVQIFNFTESTIKILGAVYLEHREESSSIRLDASEGAVLQSRDYVECSVTVAADFDVADYSVIARGVDSDNDGYRDWDTWPVSSYEHELERTKTFSISDEIKRQIGEKPTNENETTEPIPGYMVAINNARLRFVLFYIFAGVFLVLAIVIHKRKESFVKSTISTYQEPVKEIIIKEIHHAPKIKKVVCTYCGSKYYDNLDGCPNCGSSENKDDAETESNDTPEANV